MIKIKHSGAKYSSIVGIGEHIRTISAQSGTEFLMLNRGINMVENIDIRPIVGFVDFNSAEIQVYPPVKGRIALREAINKAFFKGEAQVGDIFITQGGVGALDLIFKTIDTQQVWLPAYYWGAYLNILQINKQKYGFYPNLDFLAQNANSFRGMTVLVCDPNNPTGLKFDDEMVLGAIRKLHSAGAVIVFDSPYRKLFFDWSTDFFYQRLLEFENLIIAESFSKSVGLSGQRIGFLHCSNKPFMDELAINLLYTTNGINNFAQILVEKILCEEVGIEAARNFRSNTVINIAQNIEYLIKRDLLANHVYQGQKPLGIFVIVRLSHQKLLENHIGSVPLNFFTKLHGVDLSQYARICVSVSHEKFTRFFNKI
jgi:aspartate aminotransferase